MNALWKWTYSWWTFALCWIIVTKLTSSLWVPLPINPLSLSISDVSPFSLWNCLRSLFRYTITGWTTSMLVLIGNVLHRLLCLLSSHSRGWREPMCPWFFSLIKEKLWHVRFIWHHHHSIISDVILIFLHGLISLHARMIVSIWCPESCETVKYFGRHVIHLLLLPQSSR